MELPNRIREHRKAAGLTLEALASPVGCSAVQLSDLERGERTLNIHWMQRISKALGIDPADLLLEQDNSLSLTKGERDLVLRYRAASGEQRAQIDQLLAIFVPAPKEADDPKLAKS